MKKWLWRALIPILALLLLLIFQHLRQIPIFVDVESQRITIYPEKIEVVQSDIYASAGPFGKWLKQMENTDDGSYLHLFLRPGSYKTSKYLIHKLRERQINFQLEPWDSGVEIVLPKRGKSPPYLDSSRNPWTFKNTAYFECRSNRLFFISMDEIKTATENKVDEIRKQEGGNEEKFLKRAASEIIEVNGQHIDFCYALMGKYELTPDPGAEGYSFDLNSPEENSKWLNAKLANLDPQKDLLWFYIRPGGLKVFREARELAHLKNFNVTCDVLDTKNSICICNHKPRLGFPQ